MPSRSTLTGLLARQAPLSRLETGQYINPRYEAMEDRLNVSLASGGTTMLCASISCRTVCTNQCVLCLLLLCSRNPLIVAKSSHMIETRKKNPLVFLRLMIVAGLTRHAFCASQRFVWRRSVQVVRKRLNRPMNYAEKVSCFSKASQSCTSLVVSRGSALCALRRW